MGDPHRYAENKHHNKSDMGFLLDDQWAKEYALRGNKASLVKVLAKSIKIPLIASWILAIINNLLLKISLIVIFGLILKYFEFVDSNISTGDNAKTAIELPMMLNPILKVVVTNVIRKVINSFINHIIFWVITLFILNIVSIYLKNKCNNITRLHGMKVKIAATRLVYSYAIRLEKTWIYTKSSSKIVNMLLNDLNLLDDFFIYLPDLVLIPIQSLILGSFIGAFYIGLYPILAGLVALVCILCARAILARLLEISYIDMIYQRQFKLSFINDIIPIIGEQTMLDSNSFKSQLRVAHENEMRSIPRANLLKALNATLAYMSPSVILLVILATYLLLDEKLTLSGSIVYTTVLFIYYLNDDLATNLPIAIYKIQELFVICNRLRHFLILTNQNTESTLSTNDIIVDSHLEGEEEAEIICDHLSADWPQPKPKPSRIVNENLQPEHFNLDQISGDCILNDINFKIKPDGLLFITGPPKSCKTTLIRTILGELNVRGGEMICGGNFSYQSQELWMIDGTLKENILCGQAIDLSRYEEILNLCHIPDDTLILSSRCSITDRSLLAQVQLARALYYQADIYLLDEPFKYIDKIKAKVLFDKVICELLKDKIVIMATKKIEFYRPNCQVLTLQNGCQKSCQKFKRQSDFNKFIKTYIDFMEVDNKLDNSDISEVVETVNLYDSDNNHLDYDYYITSCDSSIRDHLRLGWGMPFVIIILSMDILSAFVHIWIDFYIMYWVKSVAQKNNHDNLPSLFNINDWFPSLGDNHLLIMTIAIIILGIIVIVKNITYMIGCSKSSIDVHKVLFEKILTRLSSNSKDSSDVFDEAKLKIIGLSGDISNVEDHFPQTILRWTSNIFSLFRMLLAIYILIPTQIILSLLLFALSFVLLRAYNYKSFNLYLTLYNERSAINSLFLTSFNGLTQIRVFKLHNFFQTKFDNIQDNLATKQRQYLTSIMSLETFLNILANIQIPMVFLSLNGIFGSPEIGLIISNCIIITSSLQASIRNLHELTVQQYSMNKLMKS